MIVQHNISGMNANRQLNITTGLQAKSAEKLSSGYRINRAADDAAGLSISEKMRRQIRGLTQASENAQDGISFVQIADGALAEVHDMIQRGNELAVKAANDTLTAQDREYINQEVTKLKEEIDAIGGKTTFNEIPIFPENGASVTEATEEQNALLEMIATEYIPNAVSQLLSSFSALATKMTEIVSTSPAAGAMDLDITYIDGPSNTLAYMAASLRVRNAAMDQFVTESLAMKVDSADYTSDNLDDKTQQMLESTLAHELMHGLMFATLPEGMGTSDTSDASYNFPLWFIEGSAQLAGGGYTTGWNDRLMYIAKAEKDGTYTSSQALSEIQEYLKTDTVENREYGHGYLACAYLSYLAAGGTGSASQSTLLSGANKIFKALLDNEAIYASGGTPVSFETAINNILPSGYTVSSVISSINNGDSAAAQFVQNLTNASYNASQFSARIYGAGSLIAGNLDAIDILGTGASEDPRMYVKSSSASSSTSDDSEKVIYLQVGSETSSENQIALKRFAMNASAIGISTASTLTRSESLKAINFFKGALVNVSSMRSYYGAMQNRLEHTVKNLDNVVENTQAAESRIRDTDMADEMVRFSNNNILAQAGQSMLAQANQTNQGVLSLLQ